jgi:hypothetical protein
VGFLVDPEWQPSVIDDDIAQNAGQDAEREIDMPPL